jgi:predicted unusual protein kinase regulating ubiquinone biosynthesis (AarF/ABC1/UbiB family)
MFTQSDMHVGSFILDPTGRLCLVDFDTVGLLPKYFAVYTVKVSHEPFVQNVAIYLPS